MVAKLEGLIQPKKRQHLIEKCASEKYTTIFAASEKLPSFFDKGELSVVVRGRSEPVLYDYHYLHRVLPNDDSKNKARRSEHASIIRNELNKIYGSAIATGHYDQSSETGFVADDDEDGPCEFWLRENVGIILCTERVIMVDGIEMALSFIRLDRAPIGHSLRCMVKPRSSDGCDDLSETTFRPIAKHVSFLETLAKWLGPETFRNCKSDDLEPIEKVWALSETEQAELASVLETHTGDDLALFAVEYAQDSEVSERKRDNFVMFLFKQAASQGSAIAMNEIGASLLYCYQHVRQDTTEARIWLEKAAAAGDTLAMKSMALMHLLGMTEVTEPTQEALRHLEKCSKLDEELCSKELTALKSFTASQRQ